MEHTHILDELLAQAHALQDSDHQVSYAHGWTSGIYAQVMAIGQDVHIWTLGTMLPGELPLVTNDYVEAATHFEALMLMQEAAF